MKRIALLVMIACGLASCGGSDHGTTTASALGIPQSMGDFGAPVPDQRPSDTSPATSPVVDVQPRTATAGSSVDVTGTCPPGTGDPFVRGFLLVDSSRFPVEAFDGSMTPDHAADGFFSTVFPIPTETPGGVWRFTLDCAAGDAVTAGNRVDVNVASGAVEHLTFATAPSPAVAGESLSVSGAGCRAQGSSLDRVDVSLSGGDQSSTSPHSVTQTAAPDATGAWRVSLELPADFPEGDATVAVQCSDTRGEQPSWGRFLQASLSVAAGVERPGAAPNALARTGFKSSAGLITVSLLLVVIGLLAVVVGARRGTGETNRV